LKNRDSKGFNSADNNHDDLWIFNIARPPPLNHTKILYITINENRKKYKPIFFIIFIRKGFILSLVEYV